MIRAQGMIMAADTATMKTVPNVPIVSTGTYHLGMNFPGPDETTFTSEDLADAVQAVHDPAVQLPRLKVGHTSEWGDGEPCFGKVDNMRLGDNNQTIYGDFTGTPAWLAEVLPAIYPNRSIEAFFNVETPTGNKYRMVISAVALLGVTLPGVSTLEDLAGLYSEEMPEGTQIEAESKVEAQIGEDMGLFSRKKGKVAASVPLEDVRRSFYEEVAVGDQTWWWIREILLDPNELIVDSDDGDLYKMSFEINGEEVSFGEAESVKIQYVNARAEGEESSAPVTARTVQSGAVAYASRSESRPDSTSEEDQVDGAELRSMLGLAAEASDEDVKAKLAKVKASEEAPADPPADPPADDPKTDPDPDPEEDKKDDDDEAKAGSVSMDSEALASLRRDAELGRKAHEAQAASSRDAFLEGAVKDGKFPPSRLEHYQKAWAGDPEGTRQLIEGLEKGIVPVEARGGSAPEQVLAGSEYPTEWLSEGERARAQGKVAAGAGTVTREEV